MSILKKINPVPIFDIPKSLTDFLHNLIDSINAYVGDMRKSTYDTNDDGIVDNASAVIGKVPTATPAASAIPIADANGSLKSWTVDADGDTTTVADVADYGGAFATYVPPTGSDGALRIAIDINATTPGKRLYVYANSAWNYVDLT